MSFVIGILIGFWAGISVWLLFGRPDKFFLKKQADNPHKNPSKLNEYIDKLENVTTELMEARILAEQASIAKNAFLANISHEIRTPLHTILGSVTLLHQSDLTDKQQTYVHRIKSSTQILLDIIGNVLDLSKIAAGEVILESVPADIPQLVQECHDVLIAKADEKKLEFTVQLPKENIPKVLCDPTRFKEVMINLLSNAIKFTEQGWVYFRIQIQSLTHEIVKLKFEIEDSGIGIPEEKVEHLFERFWQADASTTRKYGGTGLGLAISKQIVDLMGGTILLQNKSDKGTLFIVIIPFFVAHQTAIDKI